MRKGSDRNEPAEVGEDSVPPNLRVANFSERADVDDNFDEPTEQEFEQVQDDIEKQVRNNHETEVAVDVEVQDLDRIEADEDAAEVEKFHAKRAINVGAVTERGSGSGLQVVESTDNTAVDVEVMEEDEDVTKNMIKDNDDEHYEGYDIVAEQDDDRENFNPETADFDNPQYKENRKQLPADDPEGQGEFKPIKTKPRSALWLLALAVFVIVVLLAALFGTGTIDTGNNKVSEVREDTDSPTLPPFSGNTLSPSVFVTNAPTPEPVRTSDPTTSPTYFPTKSPTKPPTPLATAAPTVHVTSSPTTSSPTSSPVVAPVASPTAPTMRPTSYPTNHPTTKTDFENQVNEACAIALAQYGSTETVLICLEGDKFGQCSDGKASDIVYGRPGDAISCRCADWYIFINNVCYPGSPPS